MELNILMAFIIANDIANIPLTVCDILHEKYGIKSIYFLCWLCPNVSIYLKNSF